MAKSEETRALSVREPFSVLVADDEEGYRDALAELLAGEGYRVFCTDCGMGALQVLQVKRIHLGILDMHMSDITGIEIISTLSSLPRAVPAILMTADHSKETRLKAMGVGAFTVVTKPFTPDAVKRIVRQIIHKFYEN
jgi:CheY-like chemotaxis protein